MSVRDSLEELRQQFPECELVAMADIASDMILATSKVEAIPQERLDGLSATAGAILRGEGAANIVDCFAGTQEDQIANAVLVSGNECDIFLSIPEDPDYAICAVGRIGMPISAFLMAATPVLKAAIGDD